MKIESRAFQFVQPRYRSLITPLAFVWLAFCGPFAVDNAYAIVIVNSYDAVDWTGSIGLQGAGGADNPALRVGFNSQPDPPDPDAPTPDVDLTDPTMPVLTVESNEVVRTGILVVITDTSLLHIPISDIAPSGGANLVFDVLKDDDSLAYTIAMNLTTGSGGTIDPDTFVAFNPSPGPPPESWNDWTNAGLVGFDFDVTSASVERLTIQVTGQDARTGNTVTYAFARAPAVPEPGSMLLVGSVLAGLVGLRQRFIGA